MSKVILRNLTSLTHFLLMLLVISAIGGKSVSGQTPVDTIISNQAQAVYTDSDNKEYKALSQIVTIKITAVNSLSVTPDETAASATVVQSAKVTRRFTVHNQGNTPDSYTITNLSTTSPAIINDLYFDTDDSHTITQADQKISLNSTVSPIVEQGKSIDVLAVLEVNNSAPNSLIDISLTARSANSNRQDSGRIVNTIAPPIALTDPDDPVAKPRLFINGQKQIRASNGETVTYEIKFRNRSVVRANNIVVADDLPGKFNTFPELCV